MGAVSARMQGRAEVEMGCKLLHQGIKGQREAPPPLKETMFRDDDLPKEGTFISWA